LADERCAEADRLEAQANAQEVAQSHAMSPSDSPLVGHTTAPLGSPAGPLRTILDGDTF
jgi:hypothetical protein